LLGRILQRSSRRECIRDFRPGALEPVPRQSNVDPFGAAARGASTLSEGAHTARRNQLCLDRH
jgi:hypothetical protein